jgi:hypothetical protein
LGLHTLQLTKMSMAGSLVLVQLDSLGCREENLWALCYSLICLPQVTRLQAHSKYKVGQRNYQYCFFFLSF